MDVIRGHCLFPTRHHNALHVPFRPDRQKDRNVGLSGPGKRRADSAAGGLAAGDAGSDRNRRTVQLRLLTPESTEF